MKKITTKERKNYFEAWMVKRVGLTPTAEKVPIYYRFAPEWDGLEAYTIFPSKKAAFAWRNHWNNQEDFDVFLVKIPNI